MRRALPLLLLCSAGLAQAQAPVPVQVPQPTDYSQHARTPQLLETLRLQLGFSAEELASVQNALRQAQKLPQLIEQEQKAPEKTQTWTQYSKRLSAARINGGLRLLRDYREELERAEQEYGVPPPVIAAVLGIETSYGAMTGNVRVLDSLATQGMDHPTRWPFFLDELGEFFAFCRDFGFAPTQPTGSYAGAMGASQFMPSNYRRLAVDFDGNGRRDLWTLPDAIGSVAHYLNEYRPELAWRRGEPMLVRARIGTPVPEGLERNGKRPTAYIHQLAQLEIVPEIPLPPSLFVGLVELPLDDGSLEYWLALPNFYSVMTYNPRTFYAMAVSRLAGLISEAQAAEAQAGDTPAATP